MTTRGRIATAAWITAWMAATAGSLALIRPVRAPIHIDEIYWIGGTYFYHLAFHERNWSHPDWKLMSARENPPVARYVIGARLALAGQHVVNREMISCFRILFDVPAEKLQRFKARREFLEDIGDATLARCSAAPLGGPGVTRKNALLPLSRQAVIACGVVASLLLFLFGAVIANRPTGLVASQVLLLHPVAVEAYGRAMADGVAMMFCIAAAWSAWEFHRRMASEAPVSNRRATFLVFLNGALLALACASKMNSLLMAGLFGAGALAAATIAWKRRDLVRVRTTLALGAATAAIAVIVFSVVNPAILIAPREGLAGVFTYHQAIIEHQQDLMPDRALLTLPHKFFAVSQVASGPVFFLLIVAFGVLAVIRWPRPGMWFAAGWFFIVLAIVTWWIPFQWPRYVAPIVPPMALLAGYATMSTFAALLERGKAWRLKGSMV